MSIYLVSLEYELVVVADSKEEAERIARREKHNEEPMVYVHNTDGMIEMIPPEWWDEIPWGGDGLTVQEMLNGID